MIGNKSPAEMRRILRERMALSDAKLLAKFNKEIADAKAKHPESSTAGEALRLLRDALLRDTTQNPRSKRRKGKVAATKTTRIS
jgi:hypothetical protein